MADGTIKFDTELDTDGLNSGLGSLCDDSGAAMSALSQSVNKNLGDVFSQIAGEAKKEASQIASDAIAAEKLYQSESERIQDSKKKAETLYLDNLKDNLDKIRQLRDEEIKCLKSSYELGLISTEEYFSRLADFRDRYFEYGSTGWQNYSAEILKHNKKLSDEQEKALAEAAETVSESIKKRYDAIAKEQENLEKRLADFGGISSRNTIVGEDVEIEFTSLANITAQNEALEEYSRLLTAVKEKVDAYWRTDTGDTTLNEKNAALRSSYFSQVRGMSVEDASDFARTMLNVSDSRLSEYLGAFEYKQQLVQNISESLFEDDVSEAADSAARSLGSDFSTALSDELEGLSGKFFSTGEEACRSFGDGFMKTLGEVLSELSAGIAAGAMELGGSGAVYAGGQSVENNTSYNIYGAATPAETIRLLREQEELKQLMMQ